MWFPYINGGGMWEQDFGSQSKGDGDVGGARRERCRGECAGKDRGMAAGR